MHPEAMELMTRHLSRVTWPKAKALDVGSLDVNGTYRELVESRGWTYTGLDIKTGPNVDIVSADPYQYPIQRETFDVVLSGSTMEHVQALWLWVPELVRLVRPGGLLVIVAPCIAPVHQYPADCWRILPDGMAYLFGMCWQLIECRYEAGRTDMVGSAFKRAAWLT